jgi:hypothetical protein
MQTAFDRIKVGMRQAEVAAIVRSPDETRQVEFGGQTLTSWIFRVDGKVVSIWFDEGGILRLKKP